MGAAAARPLSLALAAPAAVPDAADAEPLAELQRSAPGLSGLVRRAEAADERLRQLDARERELAAAEAALEERTQELAERERRFSSRWAWLLRALRPPRPRLHREARVCQFLLAPSPHGYVLLPQDGLALKRGATLTGLLGEERSFVVTKIAPWAFDGRWCAYLQEG